jgi:hypothetical protein
MSSPGHHVIIWKEKCQLGPKEKYVNVCACINETNKYQSVPIKREEVAVLYMYAFSPPSPPSQYTLYNHHGNGKFSS